MSELISRFPLVRPVRSESDWKLIQEEAAKDGLSFVLPTHVVEKGGTLAGALGLNSIPLARVWLHSQRNTARDSAHVICLAENLMRANGVTMATVLMSPASPLLAMAEAMGWKPMRSALMCVKNLGE